MAKVIIALDTPNLPKAEVLVATLGDVAWGFKVGPKLFYPNYYRERFDDIITMDAHLFLDMKFHDTPDTVRGAINGVKYINPSIITIHAQGGYKMMKAAIEERDKIWDNQYPKPLIVAVTILTSINSEVWERINPIPKEYVLDNLLDEVVHCGVDGIVCSGKEVGWVKNKYPELLTVVPGVRSPGADTHDQARVVTPKEAADDGADFLVIGREVTEDAIPKDALLKILDTLKK